MKVQAMQNRKELAVLAGLLAGLCAATVCDLPLAKAVYAPESRWAAYCEAFAGYPLFMPYLLWLLAAANHGRAAGWLRGVYVALVTAGIGLLFAYSCHCLSVRGISAPIIAAGVVWTLLFFLYMVLLWHEQNCSQQWREKERLCLRWMCWYALTAQICIIVLKLLWGRARFDEMYLLGDFSAFTPWYQPFVQAGTSFPSGHTAAACGVFGLLFVCDVFAWPQKGRRAVWVVCMIVPVAAAGSRMVLGRHFLSDVLGAALLMLLLVWQMRRCMMYQAQVQAMQKT